VKPQYVDQLPKAVKGPTRTVGGLLTARAQMDNLEKILDVLGIYYLSYRETLLILYSRTTAGS
jgi:ATP-binding cassette subfamily E protein 1